MQTKEKYLKQYRQDLVKELTNYHGEPIKLPIPSDLLKEILFKDYFENGTFYIFISKLRKVYPKIDFSNIDFSCVDVFDTDLTKLHGVHINPQTIFGKNLCFARCSGVDFDYNSFEGVKVRGTNFTGSKNVIIDPQLIYENDLCDGKYPVEFITSPLNATMNVFTDLEGSNYKKFIESNSDIRRLTRKI